MRPVYVDTSALARLVFREPGAASVRRQLRAAGNLVASNLVEAELRAALEREAVPFGDAAAEILSWVEWILPTRSLGPEFERVLEHGQLRGADLWHLACALYFGQMVEEVGFLSADRKQREVAGRLGFELVG